MKPKFPSVTIGLDLGDKKHAICVLNSVAADRHEPHNFNPNRPALTRQQGISVLQKISKNFRPPMSYHIMSLSKHITIAIVCSLLLAPLVAEAGEEMSREPGPGEKIEPTKIGDDKTTQLLVGTWMHEDKIGDSYEVKQTYTFEKDGSYQMNSVKRIRKEKIESNVKGQWTVRDGILTLTPTDPKGKEESLYGRFTAYTILKISDKTIEWQINWQRSDTSPAVKRTLTITTHKRVK